MRQAGHDICRVIGSISALATGMIVAVNRLRPLPARYERSGGAYQAFTPPRLRVHYLGPSQTFESGLPNRELSNKSRFLGSESAGRTSRIQALRSEIAVVLEQGIFPL